MNRIWFASGIVVLLSGLGTSARAASIVVPNSDAAAEDAGNESFPFNSGIFTIRYQEVFGAAQFGALGGPQNITAIRFRPDGRFGSAFSSTLSSIQIDLSTTPVGPGALSATFASNVGADDTVVFAKGALMLSSSNTGPAGGPKNFDIVINLSTPFLYDPSKGSLLLDVRNFGGGTTTVFDGVSRAGCSADVACPPGQATQRVEAAGNMGDPNGGVNAASGNLDRGSNTSNGLVAQFTFGSQTAAVPEPSTLSFLVMGLGGLVAAGARRKSRE